MRIVKILGLLIVVVITTYMGSKKYIRYSQTQEVEEFVEMAKELSQYLPNEEMRNSVQFALDSVKIYHDDSPSDSIINLTTEGERFILVIDNFFVSDSKDETIVYRFLDEPAKQSGQIVIVLNEKMLGASKNKEVLGANLIHEFIHGLQYMNLLQNPSLKPTLGFKDEMEAWGYATYVFLEKHPEMKSVQCDCDTQTIISDDPQVHSDEGLRNLLYFNSCGEKFLKGLYDELHNKNPQ